jgi:hypothetical protein
VLVVLVVVEHISFDKQSMHYFCKQLLRELVQNRTARLLVLGNHMVQVLVLVLVVVLVLVHILPNMHFYYYFCMQLLHLLVKFHKYSMPQHYNRMDWMVVVVCPHW